MDSSSRGAKNAAMADAMSVSNLTWCRYLISHFYSSLRNQTTSPLLRLPGEIRNKIYSYAFQDQKISVRRHTGRLENRMSSRGLLFASRQLLREAHQAWLSSNITLYMPAAGSNKLFRKTVSEATLQPVGRLRMSRREACLDKFADWSYCARCLKGIHLPCLVMVEVCRCAGPLQIYMSWPFLIGSHRPLPVVLVEHDDSCLEPHPVSKNPRSEPVGPRLTSGERPALQSTRHS